MQSVTPQEARRIAQERNKEFSDLKIGLIADLERQLIKVREDQERQKSVPDQFERLKRLEINIMEMLELARKMTDEVCS